MRAMWLMQPCQGVRSLVLSSTHLERLPSPAHFAARALHSSRWGCDAPAVASTAKGRDHVHQLAVDATNKHVNVSSIAAALMLLKDPKSAYVARPLDQLGFDRVFYRKGCTKFLRHAFFNGNKRTFDANDVYLTSVRQRCVDLSLSQPHINPLLTRYSFCFPEAWSVWPQGSLGFHREADTTLLPESNVFEHEVLKSGAESNTGRLQDVLCDVLYEDVLAYCRHYRRKKVRARAFVAVCPRQSNL
jgi:hypothetical protein